VTELNWPTGTQFVVKSGGKYHLWILGPAHDKRQSSIAPNSALGECLQQITTGESIVQEYPDGRQESVYIADILDRGVPSPSNIQQHGLESEKRNKALNTPTKTQRNRRASNRAPRRRRLPRRRTNNSAGVTRGGIYYAHCWRCGSNIDSVSTAKCEQCGWLECNECGACDCDRPQ
jgi:hypothetical protein